MGPFIASSDAAGTALVVAAYYRFSKYAPVTGTGDGGLAGLRLLHIQL